MVNCKKCKWLKTDSCPVIYDNAIQSTPVLVFCVKFEDVDKEKGDKDEKGR